MGVASSRGQTRREPGTDPRVCPHGGTGMQEPGTDPQGLSPQGHSAAESAAYSIALTMSSTTFFASPKTIIVLSM